MELGVFYSYDMKFTVLPEGSPCWLKSKVLDNSHEVSEFELQLRYHIHFRNNILGKDMNHFFPSNSLHNITAVIPEEWLWY